jgi:hypothetical protein
MVSCPNEDLQAIGKAGTINNKSLDLYVSDFLKDFLFCKEISIHVK